jgi:hypothetical protein
MFRIVLHNLLRCIAAAAFFLGILDTTAAQASTPRISLVGSADLGYSVEVTGLDESALSRLASLSAVDLAQAFTLSVGAEAGDVPPLTGTLSVDGGVLRFQPRYPLEEGLSYQAVLTTSPESDNAKASRLTQVVEVPSSDSEPTTVVTNIYPTADVLPENQLKFYIHFSAPMSRGEAYQHVHLLDEDDRPVEGVFLELGEELWDADQQRFTLLFDPGRVKRGLKPREELGPAIVQGRSYSLVVDSAWRDATRTPLNAGARKHFRVGPPDEAPIDTTSWNVTAPAAGSRDPLLVRFGEPLDHSLLERVVRVVGPGGQRVAGTIATGDREACWQFTPEAPWPSGNYNLTADTTLEDLAGNSIGRPFEVDEFDKVDERLESKSISIPFEVKPEP